MELEWPARKLNDSLTFCILDAAIGEIRKNNANKTACNVAPKEGARFSKGRGRLYARYKATGSDETLELIHAKSREITNLLAHRRKNGWGSVCRNMDYQAGPRLAAHFANSISGKSYAAQTYEALMGSADEDRLLLKASLKSGEFANHFSKPPFELTRGQISTQER